MAEETLSSGFQAAFASLGRAISLAPDWDGKRLAWRNGLHEALTNWHGIDRTTIVDECYLIAEAKGLTEQYSTDEIQHDIAEEVEQAEQQQPPSGNGKDHYHGPDAQVEIVPEIEPLAFFSAANFENRALRDRAWLVPNRIPMGNVSLLGGDGATGKTTIALQLAAAVVRGTDWLKATIDQPGSVLFFTAEEDEDEVHRRLKIISDNFGFSFRELLNLQINCMPGQNSILAKPDRSGEVKPTKLFARMELTIRVQRPRLICLESSADLFAGNEIDRPQVRQFVSLLRSWSMIDGAAVLLLSHPSLSGMGSGAGTSGSTAWNNSVRSRLYFSIKKGREEHDEETRNDFRILEVKKSNYGPSGETVECVWKPPGVFVPVDQVVDLPEVKANKERNAEHAFLHCLDVRNSHQQWVNQLESSHSRYAPKVFERMAEAEGFKAKQLATAMTRLLDKNMIKIGKSPDTSPSKRFDVLLRTQPTLV